MKPRAYVDFETEGIEKRPEYPPKPVGVAIIDGRIKRYMSWGHPSGNNCTKREATGALKKIYREAKTKPVCFHNAGFDLEVGNVHLGLPLLPHNQFEDTLFLAFLNDPREAEFKLKYLADRYLDMPPEEQEKLRDWIIDHVSGATAKNFGQFIALAPGKLVGRYAIGDVVRTKGLYELFLPVIIDNGMQEAYEREKKLVHRINHMEHQGIRIDYKTLYKDLQVREQELASIDKWLRRKLGDINLDSGKQLAEALEAKGYVDEFEYTEKGNVRTGRESLERVCNNTAIVKKLDRMSRLNKIVGTYMRPWYEKSSVNGGIYHPWFSQTRDADRPRGTKTGRFSSDFQQVPRKPKDPSLPYMRHYVVRRDKDSTLIDRDFSQQELRILAHYEDDDLMQMYLDNPKTDMHEEVNQMIIQVTGKDYGRPKVKVVNFSTIYGAGKARVSAELGISMDDTADLLAAHKNALPGLKDLKDDLKKTARRDEPIFTLGGRMYYCEEPAIIQGRERTFEYKMLNLLIQGSAADHSKEAMIRIHEAMDAEFKDEWSMYMPVHDEFLLNVPKHLWKECMVVMRDAMNFDFMDVPMLSDGKQGFRWGSMKKVKI